MPGATSYPHVSVAPAATNSQNHPTSTSAPPEHLENDENCAPLSEDPSKRQLKRGRSDSTSLEQDKPAKRHKTAPKPNGKGHESEMPATSVTAADTAQHPISLSALVGNKSVITQPGNASQTHKVSANTGERAPSQNAPNDIFTTPVIENSAPWPYPWPAPTPTFPVAIACPIDWSKIAGLKAPDIEAYELRTPWNPTQKTWKLIAAQVKQQKGIDACEEAYRKRFKKANRAVYRATGVYFHNTVIGLESEGIKQGKDRPVLAAEDKSTKISNIYQPPVFNGRLNHYLLQGTDKFNPLVMRNVDADLIQKVCQNQVPGGEILPFSVKTFDHWYSFFALGWRKDFPRRVYHLQRREEWQYVDEMSVVSLSDYLQTYALSQYMGTPQISDCIVDEIFRTFKADDQPVNIANIEAKDINFIWNNTSLQDPLRHLLLDILAYQNTFRGSEIDPHSKDYHPMFLQAQKLHKLSTKRKIQEEYVQNLTLEVQALVHNDDMTQEISDKMSKKMSKAQQSLLMFEIAVKQVKKDIADLEDDEEPAQDDSLCAPRSNISEFLVADNPDDFCKLYHNHGQDSTCYRFRAPTYSLGPDEDPGCVAEHTATPATSQAARENEEGGEYEAPYCTLSRKDCPDGATGVRRDEETKDLLFDLPVPNWYPPMDPEDPDDDSDVARVQRLEDWQLAGKKVPRITYRLWRPFEGVDAYYKPPF